MKVAILLVCVGSAAAQHPGHEHHSWWKSVKTHAASIFADVADPVSPAELLRQGNNFTVESCSDSNHSMMVDSVHFDADSLKVMIRGNLTREVFGGNVSAKIRLGKSPEGLSFGAKALRSLAFFKHHLVTEPLCAHMKRTANVTCPIARGTKELSFSFNRLPKVVVAGEYRLKFTAVDEQERPVVCVQGRFFVPLGPNGESTRTLQEMTASRAQSWMANPLTIVVSAILAAVTV